MIRESSNGDFRSVKDIGSFEVREGVTNTEINEYVRGLCQHWLNEHPLYEPNGANCQLFVQHICMLLVGVRPKTQNRIIGSKVQEAGFTAVILGLFAVIVGTVIRGSHA